MTAGDQVLGVFIGEMEAGTVVQERNGRLRFAYTPGYAHRDDAIPLSLSMPLTEESHPHDRIHPWLWNLLPDNEIVLERWARRFGVSARNAFSLLREIGEDCSGAVRFVVGGESRSRDGGRRKLESEEIARRLQALARDPALGRESRDPGQFSLAGAQTKTALQFDGSAWYLPWGSEPTTHILKLPRADPSGHLENELFCMRLAAAMEMPVAPTEIMTFGHERALVSRRYDRTRIGDRWVRVHQEDACQALAVHPARKYENDGGPGIVEIMELLNRTSKPVDDRKRFIEAIVFNYLILGSDAHAKNFSLLLGPHGQIRLAPLYDIASLLPYASQRSDFRFAMRIGRHYRDEQIQRRHFASAARACEFPVAEMMETLSRQAERIPDAMSGVAAELSESGITHPIIGQLVDGISDRARAKLDELT